MPASLGRRRLYRVGNERQTGDGLIRQRRDQRRLRRGRLRGSGRRLRRRALCWWRSFGGRKLLSDGHRGLRPRSDRPGLRCLGLRGGASGGGASVVCDGAPVVVGRGGGPWCVVTRVDGVGSSRPLVSRTTTAAIAASTTATPAARNANRWRYHGDGTAWPDVAPLARRRLGADGGRRRRSRRMGRRRGGPRPLTTPARRAQPALVARALQPRRGAFGSTATDVAPSSTVPQTARARRRSRLPAWAPTVTTGSEAPTAWS